MSKKKKQIRLFYTQLEFYTFLFFLCKKKK